MVITLCFASIGAVLLFFLSEEGFKKVQDEKAQMELQIANANVNLTNEVEEPVEEAGYLKQGYELIETEDAIHDLMFDNATNIVMDNGPIHVNVTNVRLEVMKPVSEHMKKQLEGMKQVTVVRLQVEATNNSEALVNFDLSSLTVGSDIGEKTRIDQVLSDKLTTPYAPGETKKGELVLLFKSKPDLLATVWVNVRSPFSESGEELGENAQLKVNLFK